jgi:hypothetical protein
MHTTTSRKSATSNRSRRRCVRQRDGPEGFATPALVRSRSFELRA